MVIVTADSLLQLFQDYLGEEWIPADAKVTKLMYKPTEQGRFAIEVESEHWPAGDRPPLEVHFDINRVYSV